MGNKWSPGCNCTCECDCVAAYSVLAAGISGVQVAGFPSTPFDLTGYNGLYTPPTPTGGCSYVRSGPEVCYDAEYVVGVRVGQNFYNVRSDIFGGGVGGCGLSFATNGCAYGGIGAAARFDTYCLSPTSAVEYIVAFGVSLACYDGLASPIDFYCLELTGQKTASTLAGLLGPITLSYVGDATAFSSVVFDSVTATVV